MGAWLIWGVWSRPLRLAEPISNAIEAFQHLGESVHHVILGRTLIWVGTMFWMGRAVVRARLLRSECHRRSQQECSKQDGSGPASKRRWHGCSLPKSGCHPVP